MHRSWTFHRRSFAPHTVWAMLTTTTSGGGSRGIRRQYFSTSESKSCASVQVTRMDKQAKKHRPRRNTVQETTKDASKKK